MKWSSWMIRRELEASSPEVGYGISQEEEIKEHEEETSSRKIIDGDPINSWAIDNLLRWPPEIDFCAPVGVPTAWFWALRSPTSERTARALEVSHLNIEQKNELVHYLLSFSWSSPLGGIRSSAANMTVCQTVS
jgi:hypothetical protein